LCTDGGEVCHLRLPCLLTVMTMMSTTMKQVQERQRAEAEQALQDVV